MAELIIDSFAGGGGASTGIETARALVAANYRPDETVPAPEFMEAAE